MNEYLKYLWRLENWLHVLLGLVSGLLSIGLFYVHPALCFFYVGAIATVALREATQKQMKVKLTTGAETAHFFSNWFNWSKKQQMELYPTIGVLGCITLIILMI